MDFIIERFFMKLSTSMKLFKYLMQRYTRLQISALNSTVGTRIKLINFNASNNFLRRCIFEKVIPRYLAVRITKSKLKHSPSTERIFMTAEIKRNELTLTKLKQSYSTQLNSVREWLTYGDFMRFLRYYTVRVNKIKDEKVDKYDKLVALLHRSRFGDSIGPSSKNIFNLSSYKLSPDEEFVLSHGLNFSIPHRKICREEILAEFEVLMGQLNHHKAKSVVDLRCLKRKLADTAYAYSGSPIDKTDFAMRNEFYENLRNLKSLEDVIITKPDKGSGVVLMDKDDFISKMSAILNDSSKFRQLGPVATHDKIATNEHHLQDRLLELVKEKQLPKNVQEAIRPCGSTRPRMYGLLKTHKAGTPLRPILEMIGSCQHKLANWLTNVLQPVLTQYVLGVLYQRFVQLRRDATANRDGSGGCGNVLIRHQEPFHECPVGNGD